MAHYAYFENNQSSSSDDDDDDYDMNGDGSKTKAAHKPLTQREIDNERRRAQFSAKPAKTNWKKKVS